MKQSEIARKNATIIRKLPDSKVLDFLKNSLNGIATKGLDESEVLSERLNYINNCGILTSLTRGQLQNFLLDPELSLLQKCRLLQSEDEYWKYKDENPLIEKDKDKIELLYDDSDYYKILEKYDEMIEDELVAAEELVEACYKYNDKLHLEEKIVVDGVDLERYVLEMERLKEYEKGNLYKILLEPNLAQRNKWLQEITELERIEDMDYYEATEMDENSRRYIYYMLKEATTRKFYRTIGVDYDEIGPNNMVPERVDFGVEIEEIGVYYGVCEVEGFDSSGDITLRDYDRSNREYIHSDTGEYQSPLLSTDYEPDYEKLVKQINILNYHGAKTNESCGFHIHVSTPYTSEYEMDEDEGEFVDTTAKARHLQKEIFEMQHVIAKNFKLFRDREIDTCSFLRTPYFDDLQIDKFQFVNMGALENGTGIEFRFLNLPFAVDKKVIDAYCDFITNYMLYIDEGNNTTEYFDEVMSEMPSFERHGMHEEDVKFEILKQQLCLKDSTMRILEYIDEIYEFHNAGEVETEQGENIDYYTMYNKPILEEDEELEVVVEQ